MHYLNVTHNYGLLYNKNEAGNLMGYLDADWTGDLGDCKSRSKCLFKLSGAATSWRSKKQASVALSTAEVEYMFFFFYCTGGTMDAVFPIQS